MKAMLLDAPGTPLRLADVPLAEANEALSRLRRGDITGALVLVPDPAL